jgi:transposase
LQGFEGLAETIQADVLIVDKGYDADKRVRAVLAAAGKTAVMPPWRNRKGPASYDKELYKKRHRIENFYRIENFVQPLEGLSRHRHALREERAHLSGWHLSGRGHHVD